MVSRELDSILQNFFLREIQLVLNDKNIAEGRLVSYFMNVDKNGFFLEFTLKNLKKKKRNTKIPFPFQYEFHYGEDILFFDYRLKTIFNEIAIDDIFQKPIELTNRFYNQILEISLI